MARLIWEDRQFKRDPWFAVRQGWILTEDEHVDVLAGHSATRPFPDKEYLRFIATLALRAPTGMLMKTRQLMMTWLFCYLLLWEAITKPGRLCVAQGKREEDVLAKGNKGLMGRIRFMRQHLPEHLQPEVKEESKSTEVYGNGSTIIAIPQGDDVIRSLTASFVFMDELEFHPEGEKAWTAALPTIKGGGRIWGVSTPNGQGFMYNQHDERLKWDTCMEDWPKASEGIWGYKNTKGMQLVALHYTADEEKREPSYQDVIKTGYTNMNMFRQENELDFTVVAGDGVYSEDFKKEVHVLKKDYKVNPMMPIYRGWDFGYNGTAVAFFQHNMTGQLIWFDQIFYRRVGLEKVVGEVLKRTVWHLGRYTEATKDKEMVEVDLFDLEGNPIPGARLARQQQIQADVQDFGDPSAEAHNTKGETDRATLAKFGIVLRTKPTTGRKKDIVEQVRSLLFPRSDGTPAMMLSPGPFVEMKLVIAGFSGGYHYPEKRAGRADKQLPHKDGIYDHVFDGASYCIDWIKPIRPAMPDEELTVWADSQGGAPWWQAPENRDNPWNKDFYNDLPYTPDRD